ncbi:MAG: L,D-transpeptidase family protein [Patescibacteria group bacterium]
MSHHKNHVRAVVAAIVFLASGFFGWSVSAAEVSTHARLETSSWRFANSTEPVRSTGYLEGLDGAPASAVLYDLGQDGVAEILVGSGFGQAPVVSLYQADGTLISRFAVYDPGMKQGVNVAAGDVDGDGRAEIVTGTGPGAAAHVLVFDGYGKMKAPAGGFFPFGRESRGGVAVAVSDVNGDGVNEIIAASGPGESPRVAVWKRPFFAAAAEFAPFAETMVAGVNVAAGDVDGDGVAEILAVPAGKSDPVARIIKVGEPASAPGGFSVSADMSNGLTVAAADIDDDGRAEIIVAPNSSGSARVAIFDHDGRLQKELSASDSGSIDGLIIAAGHMGSGQTVLAISAGRTASGRIFESKYIVVSVAEQRLHAYEYGREVRSFLVSTGTKKYATPTGDFSVLAKIPTVLYRWSYGPNDPNNYDLGRVPWNLRIMPHIYIHYAPWHNNFGRRMSHGCVNVNKANAEWIYDWAEVGVPVSINE